MTRFDNQAIVITGAARGLGLAYARLIGSLGGRILVQDTGADREGRGQDPELAERAAAYLRSQGFDAVHSSTAIETEAGCQALVEEAVGAFGRIEALIHNAGWVGYEPIGTITADFTRRITALGIETPLWLAQAAWPHMRVARYGRIVLTTSDRAIYPEHAQEGLAAYAASKLATVGIANILAHEGAVHGIKVNCISPVAKTRMWGIEGEPDELEPAKVAPGAAYLASRACSASAVVLRASNGQFLAIRNTEASGVDYPRDLRAHHAATIDAIAQAWEEIDPAPKECSA